MSRTTTKTAPRIGFKRHLRAETVPGEGVFLISPKGTIMMTGRGVEAIAPLLDGTRSIGQVQRAVAPGITRRQVMNVVGRLADADLVSYRRVAPGDDPDFRASAYWEHACLDPDRVAAALAGHRVRVAAPDDAAAAMAEACRAAGVAVADGGDEATFTLAYCDDYLEPGLAELNTALLAGGGPWLPVRPTGADVWLGPVFGLADGPCLSCLTGRLDAHRMVESYLETATGNRGPLRPPDAGLPITAALGMRAAVLEMVKWLAGYRHPGQRELVTLNTLTLESARHPVTRRPQCADCGDPGVVADQARRPVAVTSRPKGGGGGHGGRAVPAERHWERYRHLADPLTGVVDGLRRDPDSAPFLSCYLSGPNLAFRAKGLNDVKAGLLHHSGGKGADDQEARVSALSEAVERYCGSRHGDELVVLDTLDGLGDAARHPNEVTLFHDRQYRDRARWNAAGHAGAAVPGPFDRSEPAEWTPVWSLVDGRQRLLPTQLLYYHRPEQIAGDVFAWADSNGSAAGSSLEDAIVHGFLELVERDGVALWWYNRTRRPAVRLEGLGDPWAEELVEHFRAMDREIWVLDLTTDVGIPVMAAVSRRTDRATQDIMLGFGAHFDIRVAVRRALTELGQLLPALLKCRSGTGGPVSIEPQLLRWWNHATVENQPYLLPSRDDPAVSPADRPYTPNGDLSDDIADIRALGLRHGLDVLVLDQTRPDVEMPVAKVIVPGLRHFWARFAPGRLYDVPVALGQLEEPTPYEELNPIAMFL
ncbi:TOMM precursor leader peptide-binding protein [Spirillospora sp. CA-255316]